MRKLLRILSAVILYGFGIFFCHSAREAAGFTYLLLSEPIDASRAEDIFTREAALADPAGFCFWGERKARWVSCEETGGTGKVTQILLSGNPGLLDASALTWREGCFLDEATAQNLFGTSDCSEQTVWCDGRPYRVLKSLSAARPTMLAAAKEADGAVLNRCVLSVPAEKGRQAAQQFLLRWDLQGERIEFYSLWVAVYDFLLVLPGILVLQLFFGGRNHIQNRKKETAFLLTTICILLFLCSRLLFLPGMFPSRWSDFSFWGRWWEGQCKNFQLAIRTPMGEHLLQMMLDMVKSILSSTAALLLILWTFRRHTDADTAD